MERGLSRNEDCPQLCPVRAILQQRDIIGQSNIGPDTPVFHTRNTPSMPSGMGGIQQTLMSEQNLALVKLTSNNMSDVILEYSHVPTDHRVLITEKVN